MRPSLAVSVILSSAAMAGCAATKAFHTKYSKPVEASAITSVGVEPKTIDVRKEEAATIRYQLADSAQVSIDLVDEAGRVVRTLTAGLQPAGRQMRAWDGRATNGASVSGGVYRYVIHARRQGREEVHDPSPTTGGEEIHPRNFTFDAKSGTLRWSMPKAGRARLRIGVQGFPHLRTLLDWQPLEAGPQQLAWDGLDASGLIRAAAHPNLSVRLSAYALADNTIIVRGGPSDPSLREQPAVYPPEARGNAAYLHARHLRESCHEAGVSLEFPPGTRRDQRGRPVLTGVVPVRVSLQPADAALLTNQRFEVMLYEDLTLLFEEEESMNPFTFMWETSRLAPGEHMLTVNILGYQDHYGLATQPVVIESGG